MDDKNRHSNLRVQAMEHFYYRFSLGNPVIGGSLIYIFEFHGIINPNKHFMGRSQCHRDKTLEFRFRSSLLAKTFCQIGAYGFTGTSYLVSQRILLMLGKFLRSLMDCNGQIECLFINIQIPETFYHPSSLIYNLYINPIVLKLLYPFRLTTIWSWMRMPNGSPALMIRRVMSTSSLEGRGSPLG